MTLGVFLAIGESFRDFKKKGQDKLLLNNNIRTYSENFDKVYIFSYEDESLNFFKNVIVLPNRYRLHRYLYGILLPLFYSHEIQTCDVFRGLQITGALPAILTKTLFKKRIVVNYGYPYAQTAYIEGKIVRSFLYWLSERFILNFCDRIIITTGFLKERLRSFSSRVRYIPNGINTSLFRPLKVTKKYPVIFVGRLEKQKNLKLLIESLTMIPKNFRKILFIGDGSLKKELVDLAKKKKVKLQVIEKIDNDNLPKYYNYAKVFVIPSLVEGNPKALLEAMSCGLAVIGSSIDSIKSVIRHEKNGLIFSGKREDLAEKMMLLLTNRKKAHIYGKTARSFIIAHYNYAKMRKKEISLLKQT